jgi:hypothetical protein
MGHIRDRFGVGSRSPATDRIAAENQELRQRQVQHQQQGQRQ